MATRTAVQLVDDLDGDTADETIRFALDGHAYEIDLSAPNATDLRDQLAPWIAKARRRTTGTKAPRATRKGTTRPVAGSAAVRAWARANGWPGIPARGRIPGDVRAAYAAAGSPS